VGKDKAGSRPFQVRRIVNIGSRSCAPGFEILTPSGPVPTASLMLFVGMSTLIGSQSVLHPNFG